MYKNIITSLIFQHKYMYKPNLIVKKTKNGEGVFSNVIIPQRKPILHLKGNIYTKDTIKNIDDVIQVGPKTYLGMSGAIDDKIRHSCNPTAYLSVVGKRAVLYSIHQIRPTMEITYDYSLSSLDSDLNTPCSCGSFNCRGEITDFISLPEDIKEKYDKLNILPIYIKYDIFKTD